MGVCLVSLKYERTSITAHYSYGKLGNYFYVLCYFDMLFYPTGCNLWDGKSVKEKFLLFKLITAGGQRKEKCCKSQAFIKCVMVTMVTG